MNLLYLLLRREFMTIELFEVFLEVLLLVRKSISGIQILAAQNNCCAIVVCSGCLQQKCFHDPFPYTIRHRDKDPVERASRHGIICRFLFLLGNLDPL